MRCPYYCTYFVIVTTPLGRLISLFHDVLCACLSVTLTMFNYLNFILCDLWHVSQVMIIVNTDTVMVIFLIWSDVMQRETIFLLLPLSKLVYV